MAKNLLLEYSEELATKCELLCKSIFLIVNIVVLIVDVICIMIDKKKNAEKPF